MRRLCLMTAGLALAAWGPKALALAAKDSAALPPADFTSALTQMLVGLFLVLAVLVGLYWLVRRFLPRPALAGGAHLRMLGRLNLGPRKYLALVEVAGRVLVLGVTSERISLLETVREPKRVAEMTADQGGSFLKAFKRAAVKSKEEA
jgi:flagellar protein FliO/FliZ